VAQRLHGASHELGSLSRAEQAYLHAQGLLANVTHRMDDEIASPSGAPTSISRMRAGTSRASHFAVHLRQREAVRSATRMPAATARVIRGHRRKIPRARRPQTQRRPGPARRSETWESRPPECPAAASRFEPEPLWPARLRTIEASGHWQKA
jgi:hypothetical protein